MPRKETVEKALQSVFLTFCIGLVIVVLFFIPVLVMAQEEQEQAPHGFDAADLTADVLYQDIRYRYFDLKDNYERHRLEAKGAFMLSTRFKIEHEIHAIRTDKSGDYESDFNEFKIKGLFRTNGKPFGIKARYVVGLEWLKDLGDYDESTGTGSDKIAPLAGLAWLPTKVDTIITTVQYFYSYDEDNDAPKTRETGPRIIYTHKLLSINGWFKADWKGIIDHEDDDDFSNTLELQLGKMISPRLGIYGEVFLGDQVLRTDSYDMAYGLGLRYMF